MKRLDSLHSAVFNEKIPPDVPSPEALDRGGEVAGASGRSCQWLFRYPRCETRVSSVLWKPMSATKQNGPTWRHTRNVTRPWSLTIHFLLSQLYENFPFFFIRVYVTAAQVC